ncbi:hypothetical protein PMZ80_010109 [Knufia obscura]|uniref:Flavin-containing monooxygenase n=1 Tax=Knufia obscura TaxID=1635080 RepID=A0ABR0RA99_9EURO|nr:hypothetical protein PMZ80_010109 [Knufia obscura]
MSGGPPTRDACIFDLAIIGAGIYGIQAARTYLELHPYDKVIVFEGSGDVGGVWSSERVYDAFWTQTPLGILEFSDMPLEGVPDHDTYHGFFPAKYVAEYLKSYVESRIYGGQTLASRIRSHSQVEVLSKVDEGWTLHVKNSTDSAVADTELGARKVIDATGLTSTPNVPSIPGQDNYQGQFLHHKGFALHQASLFSATGPQRIAVIGGAKSAADVAYACAKAGKDVTWIIRRSGAGPAAFVSAKGSWPYNNSNESFYTRLTSHFLVSWFFDESKTRLGRFLYGTGLGRAFIGWVWKAISRKASGLANYDREDGRKNGFHNLRPDTEIFWQNDSTGVCQRDDFFDTIARKVKVYREDIKEMNAHGLELADGTIASADCVIFATGWKTSHPRIKVQEDGQNLTLSLGLSVSEPQASEASNNWEELISSASKQILARFPVLQHRPRYHDGPDNKAPLRLYKGVLPINDRSIAFVGQMLSGNNFRIAEVQALYAVAALDGVLLLPSKEHMRTTVAETIAWNRARYLSKGRHGNWLYWDMVPYTDDLLQELGLHSHRHTSYWKDLLMPCFARDLVGLIEEHRAKTLRARKFQ